MVSALLILGALNFYDVAVADRVPSIDAVYGDMDLAYGCPDRDLVAKIDDPLRAWESLQPALQILDSVCPQASDWARDRYTSGNITWINRGQDDAYAQYMHISKKLVIDSDLFSLRNGERACTIAHEFRHSRQNLSKPLKLSFSLLLTGRRNLSIIEDDAHYFEAQVREAIFGWQHGRR